MADDQAAPDGALGREVERTARRLDRVERLLRVLSEEITGLRERIDTALPDQPGMRAWLEAEDLARARDDLGDLIGWLARIYVRYPDAGLVSCWAWHPAVVEELWWLRCAHHDAYHGPHASAAKAGDWHDRQRPGVNPNASAPGCGTATWPATSTICRPAWFPWPAPPTASQRPGPSCGPRHHPHPRRSPKPTPTTATNTGPAPDEHQQPDHQ